MIRFLRWLVGLPIVLVGLGFGGTAVNNFFFALRLPRNHIPMPPMLPNNVWDPIASFFLSALIVLLGLRIIGKKSKLP
jgi:hypothetical protein